MQTISFALPSFLKFRVSLHLKKTSFSFTFRARVMVMNSLSFSSSANVFISPSFFFIQFFKN